MELPDFSRRKAAENQRQRRKKQNKDGEPDSQEEGKPDQVEGKPDQEKVELHFEDVEEFPVLSSAKVSDNMATRKSYSAVSQEKKPVQRSSVLELEKNKTSSSEELPRKDNSNIGALSNRRKSILTDPKGMHAVLGRITVTVLPKMCQQILESIISADNLYCSFQNRNDLKKILVKTEQEIITAMKANGYKHFTVQLCYKILRHEQCAGQPKQKWGNVPLHTDVHISDDIERIRLSRNKIVSMETKSLDNTTFLTLIDEFTEIAKRVDIYLKKGDMFLLQIEPTKSMTKAEIESTVKEIRKLPVIKDNPFPVQIINQGRTNYARLGLVVVDIFQNIFREIMRGKIAPDFLYAHIEKQYENDPSLFNDMTDQEYASLNTLTNGTYDKIDFTLSYKLIRAFSFLVNPKQGWGRQPKDMDVTISDDVDRLRIMRNKIVHRINADIDLIEMNKYFSNIVNITQRIDTYLGKQSDHGFASEVLNFQTHCMDSEMEQKYYQTLKDIEDIKEKYSEGNVHIYYGKTFSNLIQDVKNKVKRSAIPIILVLEDINDNKKTRIMNELKTEINLRLVDIKFKQASSGSLIIYIDILDSNLLSTEHELGHQIHNFLCRALQLIGFNMKTENEITVVLIKDEDDIEVELLIESDNWEAYDEEICLELDVNTEIINTEQKMPSEFGLFVKSVPGSNGKSNIDSVSTRLEPGIVGDCLIEVSTLTDWTVMASKERENFNKISTLIVDHAKDSLVDVLEIHLIINSLSFEDFINLHQHDIYHLCFNKRRCCQCPQGYVLPNSRVLHPPQLEILLDKYGVARPCHVPGRRADFCCCLAKPGVTTNVLDITLARCLLINFCDDVFKKNSLRKNIDTLHQMRNNVYGHAKEGRITDVNYRIYKNEIESAILEIAKVCENETEKNQILVDLEKRSLDETLCIQYHNTLLEQIAKETQLEEKLNDLAEKFPKIVEKAVVKALDGDTEQKLTKDKSEGLSKEENNYLRLYYTHQKIATQAVCLMFDREVPGHKLESFLREHRSILTSKKSNCRCTKQQESILFPGGHVVVISADFDFTLLYQLIRHLLTAIPPPTCGWGNKPLPGHLNETDDIERIRYLRNYLSHNPELKISDADFFTYWTDLSQAIDRLSKGSLSKDVESMRTKIFYKCSKNKMEEDIRKEQEQMYKDIIGLKQQVDANKQDLVDIKKIIVDNEQEIHNSNTSHIELNTQSNLPMLSEKGLMYVASKLGFDWTQVALSLNITQAELEQMQMDYPCQVVKQITVALIRWRKRQHNRPQDTIKQLIEALQVAERQDIINDLREKYGTDYIGKEI